MSMRERRNPEHYYPEPQPNIPTMSDGDRDEQREQAERATAGPVPDSYIIAAMIEYGGSFVHALAEMARHADSYNLRKIKATWPDYWREYEDMGRDLWRQDV